MSVQVAATQEARALAALGLEALREEWLRREWGDPPKLRSPDLLRRMIASRIQAAAFGGLDPETKRLLKRGARGRPTGLQPGVRITREWQGGTIEVEVIDGGFRYAGDQYPSLSAIASRVTGVKWNGPRFFGLRGERAE